MTDFLTSLQIENYGRPDRWQANLSKILSKLGDHDVARYLSILHFTPSTQRFFMQPIQRLLVLLCIVLLVGCGGNPITKDNYNKIQTGMTLAEVESILGSGTEQASSDASFGGISIDMKNMVWQNEDKIISITFSHDKVQAKSQIGL